MALKQIFCWLTAASEGFSAELVPSWSHPPPLSVWNQHDLQSQPNYISVSPELSRV